MWNRKMEDNLHSVEERINSEFGQISLQTQPFNVDYARYYHREMGVGLYKKFVVVDTLIQKCEGVSIKKWAVSLEDHYSLKGHRTVNIDPVWLDEYQVVALSKKYRGSRICIGKGVYGEMELFYHHGSFHPFPWTYIDYKEYTNFFEEVRKMYLNKVKEL